MKSFSNDWTVKIDVNAHLSFFHNRKNLKFNENRFRSFPLNLICIPTSSIYNLKSVPLISALIQSSTWTLITEKKIYELRKLRLVCFGFFIDYFWSSKRLVMGYKFFVASFTLAIVAMIENSEAKVNMFELLIARSQCMKTSTKLDFSTKTECNIGFFKSICANRKAFSFGNEGNTPALCNCVEQFSR